VLVTGAADLIGVPVVRCLRAQGFRVVAVNDGSAGTLHRLDEFADSAEVRLRVLDSLRVLDIRHRAEFTRLMMTESPWGVVHLAARHFIPDCETSPAETLDINVMGKQNVLDACAARPPERLVFASTADVYAPSDSPHEEGDRVEPQGVYGWSKLPRQPLLPA
jgi:UDP-glucose 4-epimerase